MKNLKIFKTISFLKGLYFYIPVFTIFLLSKNISLSDILISQMLYSVLTFVGEVPTGIFADKFGQKVSIVLGYIIESLGIITIIFFPTTIGLYFSNSIRGFANSFLSGSEEALLYESVKHTESGNFKKIYSNFLSNKQIGFIFSTLLTGLIYKYVGAMAFVPLIAFSALCILGASVIALFLSDYSVSIKNSIEGSHMFSILKESVALIRRNKTIFTFTIVSILTIPGQYFIQAIYPQHFQAHGVSAFWIGATLSLGTLLNLILTRYTYLIEEYMTIEKILLILNVTLGTAYILMAVLLHPIFLVGLYILMNGMFNLQAPIISDYVNTRTKSSIRTTVLSGISFIQRVVQVVITWSLAYIVGAFGTETSLVVQGVYLIVGIAIGYYLLVHCGCTYKVANTEGEELQFT